MKTNIRYTVKQEDRLSMININNLSIEQTINELYSLLHEFGYFLPVDMEKRYTSICNSYLESLRATDTKIGYNYVGEQYNEYYLFELTLMQIQSYNFGVRAHDVSLYSIALDIVNQIKYLDARRKAEIPHNPKEEAQYMQRLYIEAREAI